MRMEAVFWKGAEIVGFSLFYAVLFTALVASLGSLLIGFFRFLGALARAVVDGYRQGL